MAGFTNRGKFLLLQYVFNAQALPANFYAALITAGTPSVTTNIKSDLTEAANGNGYVTGGVALGKTIADFPSLTEDDAGNKATIRLSNTKTTWTAAGGLLPSNAGATYMILTDDNATQGSRQVLAFWSLGAARQVSDTQSLNVQNAELDLTE